MHGTHFMVFMVQNLEIPMFSDTSPSRQQQVPNPSALTER
jgi:hypothetical protein